MAKPLRCVALVEAESGQTFSAEELASLVIKPLAWLCNQGAYLRARQALKAR